MTGRGIVYTESMVHSPTPQFAGDVPYQLAIVEFPDGHRLTARIEGERASIGDPVELVEERAGVSFFRKSV